jgi:hypothetical protein
VIWCIVKLFINYRREDTDDFAARLYDYLKSEFGGDNIFKDVDSIRPGQNWKIVLEQSVGQCDVVLALIGNQWLSCKDKKGTKRIHSEEDWVRFELEAAQRANRLIMPILVKGTEPPRKDELPDSLQWLSDIHATEVRGGAHFKDDVARLISELRIRQDRPSPRPPLVSGPEVTQAPGSILCPKCRRPCTRADKFCEGCGTTLWSICPKCVAPVLAGQRFCTSCGADVNKIVQATQKRDDLYGQFTAIASTGTALEQLGAAETLLKEIEFSLTAFPSFLPLEELRGQIITSVSKTGQAAGKKAYETNHYGTAFTLIQRLEALGCGTPEGRQYLAKIFSFRKTMEEKISECTQTGELRTALSILQDLHSRFPEDQPLADKVKACNEVLERVKQLTEKGIRELKSQHRLVQLERELTWLQSTKMNVQKLPELLASVRKQLTQANNDIARAHAEMQAGNVRTAQNIARDILTVVADHEEANLLVRQSSEIVDWVAQLQALVGQKQWCAARHLEQSIEENRINDPRLPKLSAQIKAGLSSLDHQLILLGIVAALMLGVAYLGIPWLAKEYFSSQPLPTWYYLAATGSAILLIAVTWMVFHSKVQTAQRLVTFFGRKNVKRPRAAAAPNTLSTTQLAPSSINALESLTATITVPAPSSADTGSKSLPRAVVITPEAAKSLGTSTAIDVALDEPERLSATELDQRIDNTCSMIEWLGLGGAIYWLSLISFNPVLLKITTPWLQFGVLCLVHVLPLLFTGLLLQGFRFWKIPTAAAGLAVLLMAALRYVDNHPILDLVLLFLSVWAVSATITAGILRISPWRTIAMAIGGALLAALLASPFVAGLFFVAQQFAPLSAETSWGRLSLALFSGATIWSIWVLMLSSPATTLVRYVTVDHIIVRGVSALACALVVGMIGFFLIAVISLALHESSLWITTWIGLFALCQFAPLLIRGQWRGSISLFAAIFCGILLLIVAIAERFLPSSGLTMLCWLLSTSAAVLLTTRTMDVYRYRAEIMSRLKARLKRFRLSFRVEVGRGV